MRIAYVTNVRLPTERAHGHQVARVCDALIKLGHDVTIFAPFRHNPVKQSFQGFHHANEHVKLRHLGTFDPIDRWWIPRFLQLPVLNWLFLGHVSRECTSTQFDVIYTRTPSLLSSLLLTNIPVIVELHTVPSRGLEDLKRAALIVCLTSPMKDALVAKGIDAKKIIVEPDAVDLVAFQKADARLWNFPYKHFIGYAGQRESMGLSKGIPELIDALGILEKTHPEAHGLIAGPTSSNTALENRIKDAEEFGVLHDLGFQFWDAIPSFLESCSVLVYPAPASNHPFYTRDTSPLKLFEYMAAGKPIVTADLPPIRDVLDESTAFFCKPGDAEDLARTLAFVIDHPEEAIKRATLARQKVEHYTWDKRMERILLAARIAA